MSIRRRSTISCRSRSLWSGGCRDLGLAAKFDLDLAVGLLGCRSHGLQKRQHLAPLDVAAQRVVEDLLERDAMVVVEVRCHEASSSGLRRHRLPAWAWPKKVAGSGDASSLQRDSPQQRKNETGERHPGRLGCRARQDHRDGILATFDGPGRAIRCAAALRDELTGIGLAIRAGLHIGEIELRDGGVGGIAVQLFAARL